MTPCSLLHKPQALLLEIPDWYIIYENASFKDVLWRFPKKKEKKFQPVARAKNAKMKHIIMTNSTESL